MKKLFVHIGTHKTGSSSIQSYIKNNREELLSSGLFTLPIELDNDLKSNGLQDWKFSNAVTGQEVHKEYLQDVAEKINGSDCNVSLISDENLESSTIAAERIQTWSELNNIDLRFIGFVRPQHEYANSIYQQNIRMGAPFSPPEFFNAVKRWRRLDFGNHFDSWKDNGRLLTIIPFSYENKKKGIIDVLFSEMGSLDFDLTSLPDSKGVVVNEAVTHGEVVFFQSVSSILSNTGVPQNEIKRYFARHRRQLHDVKFPGPKHNALDDSLIDEYEAFFRGTNKKFCRKFFPQETWDDVFGKSIENVRGRVCSTISLQETKDSFEQAYEFVQKFN